MNTKEIIYDYHTILCQNRNKFVMNAKAYCVHKSRIFLAFHEKILPVFYDTHGVASLWTPIYLLVSSYRQSVVAKFYSLQQEFLSRRIFWLLTCYYPHAWNFTSRNVLCIPAVTFISSIRLSVVTLPFFICYLTVKG